MDLGEKCLMVNLKKQKNFIMNSEMGDWEEVLEID